MGIHSINKPMKTYKISIVPSNMVEMVWDKVGPMIQTVVDLVPTNFCINAQKEYLVTGEKVLIAVTEDEKLLAVITSEIQTFETGFKILYVPIVSGSRMREWMDDVMTVLISLAKQHGCKEIRGQGLKDSWGRTMKKYDMKKVSTIFKMEIKE